jgi:hypothetical protein
LVQQVPGSGCSNRAGARRGRSRMKIVVLRGGRLRRRSHGIAADTADHGVTALGTGDGRWVLINVSAAVAQQRDPEGRAPARPGRLRGPDDHAAGAARAAALRRRALAQGAGGRRPPRLGVQRRRHADAGVHRHRHPGRHAAAFGQPPAPGDRRHHRAGRARPDHRPARLLRPGAERQADCLLVDGQLPADREPDWVEQFSRLPARHKVLFEDGTPTRRQALAMRGIEMAYDGLEIEL